MLIVVKATTYLMKNNDIRTIKNSSFFYCLLYKFYLKVKVKNVQGRNVKVRKTYRVKKIEGRNVKVKNV